MTVSSDTRFTRVYALLQQQFGDALIALNDESEEHLGHQGAQSGASHYELILDKTLLTQYGTLIALHRAVYACLDGLIPHEVHALRIHLTTGT